MKDVDGVGSRDSDRVTEELREAERVALPLPLGDRVAEAVLEALAVALLEPPGEMLRVGVVLLLSDLVADDVRLWEGVVLPLPLTEREGLVEGDAPRVVVVVGDVDEVALKVPVPLGLALSDDDNVVLGLTVGEEVAHGARIMNRVKGTHGRGRLGGTKLGVVYRDEPTTRRRLLMMPLDHWL